MNKIAGNAKWIILCKIVQSIMGFVVSTLTARYLGPSNFGIINYASSLTAFVLPVMYLGLNSIIVQELINHENEEGEILGTTFVLSVLSGFLCIVGINTFVYITNKGDYTTIIVCLIYSVILLFQALEMIVFWFQARYKSKYSSIISLFAYFVVTIYRVIILIKGKSVLWFAFSGTLDYLVISLFGIILYKKQGGQKLAFSKKWALDLLKKSKYYIVSAMMVTIYTQTDKIMIKMMIDDANTGYYSAAIVCSTITSFVFQAIIDSFRPYIFECKKESTQKMEDSLIKLYAIIIFLSLFQCVATVVFSSFIILIIYGEDYLAAVTTLRIVVWYTTFSYIGSIRSIYILAEEKQKYLWIINLSGAIMNIVLNYNLIKRFGINGAAIASVITQLFNNYITTYFIHPIRKNNELIIKSLNPKVLKSSIMSLLNSK